MTTSPGCSMPRPPLSGEQRDMLALLLRRPRRR